MSAPRDRVRDALRRAASGTESDVSRLVDAVPAMMAEARRRRAVRPDLRAIVEARSRWAVPRLAVATAVAVVLASIALLSPRVASTTPASGAVEGAILEGATGTGSGANDPLLDAVLDAGRSDG